MAVTAPVLTSGVGTPLITAVTAATAWLARSGGQPGPGRGPPTFPQGGREGKTNAARIRAYRNVFGVPLQFFLYFWNGQPFLCDDGSGPRYLIY